MSTSFTVETIPPLRDLAGRFVKADEELLNMRREGMRVLGRKFVAVLREEAPYGRTGRFRQSIGYRTDTEGNSVSMRTYSAKPLGNFIVYGTKPHPIEASAASALYFFWPKFGGYVVVPKAGGFRTHISKDGKLWVGKGHVDHPGTKPNPYVQRAYDRMEPELDMEVKRLTRGYIAVVKGQE